MSRRILCRETRGSLVIPSLTVLAALLTTPAHAEDEPEGEESSDESEEDESVEDESKADVLSRYRTPFDVLAERTIGTASTPVEFNWRRTDVQFAATGNHFFELNNFDSIRAGGMVRLPSEGLIFELQLSHVWVWDTPSSELLALTPYRQPGRPPRMELDFTVGMPLAEGVVTTFPRIFPAAQMAFVAYGGLRYLIYPSGFSGMTAREVGGALFSPTMTTQELDNLEDKRLDAMLIDSARYGLMAGFGNDIYFKQGLFVLPRVMFALPLLAPITESELVFWADFSLAVGVAF